MRQIWREIKIPRFSNENIIFKLELRYIELRFYTDSKVRRFWVNEYTERRLERVTLQVILHLVGDSEHAASDVSVICHSDLQSARYCIEKAEVVWYRLIAILDIDLNRQENLSNIGYRVFLVF